MLDCYVHDFHAKLSAFIIRYLNACFTDDVMLYRMVEVYSSHEVSTCVVRNNRSGPCDVNILTEQVHTVTALVSECSRCKYPA